MVVFVMTFGIWVTLLAVGLWSEHWLVRGGMMVPLTLASGQLFMLGHDAGHGSFCTSPVVNAVVGRLALIPSAHVFGLWRAHHDIHHRYTNLSGRDFVWTPVSVAEYRALSWRRRTLHRAYRHRSGLGLGLHYTIEIWAPRMLWPRAGHELPKERGRLKAAAIMFYAMLGGLAVSAREFVAVVSPEHVGDTRFWTSAIALLFLVPLIGTHWLIGFVIYLNHTHPTIVWYDDLTEWTRHQVQLEGSSGLRFRRWHQPLLPRRIMNHTAHHVDPAIPLAGLAKAQQHLVDTCPDRIVSYDWSVREFRNTLSRCKLYDYNSRRWLTYAAIEDQP